MQLLKEISEAQKKAWGVVLGQTYPAAVFLDISTCLHRHISVLGKIWKLHIIFGMLGPKGFLRE